MIHNSSDEEDDYGRGGGGRMGHHGGAMAQQQGGLSRGSVQQPQPGMMNPQQQQQYMMQQQMYGGQQPQMQPQQMGMMTPQQQQQYMLQQQQMMQQQQRGQTGQQVYPGQQQQQYGQMPPQGQQFQQQAGNYGAQNQLPQPQLTQQQMMQLQQMNPQQQQQFLLQIQQQQQLQYQQQTTGQLQAPQNQAAPQQPQQQQQIGRGQQVPTQGATPQNYTDPTAMNDPSGSQIVPVASTVTSSTGGDEVDRNERYQLFVFVLRCIAYPFNAKQPQDAPRRQLRVTVQQLNVIKDRFAAFLRGENPQIQCDEAFTNAVQSYVEVFLKSERVQRMVNQGAWSSNDFREVFHNNIEKRIRSLPELPRGMSKETVLNSWMSKFDAIFRGDDDLRGRESKVKAELNISTPQLVAIFANILKIRAGDIEVIKRAVQFENQDEQTAQIRRELEQRHQAVEVIAKAKRANIPPLLTLQMDGLYIEELKAQIHRLKHNLENVPVIKEREAREAKAKASKSKLPGGAKGGSASANSGNRGRSGSTSSGSTTNSNMPDSSGRDVNLSKNDIRLQFNISVIVRRVQGIDFLPPNKIVYCTMEVEGTEKLQTNQAEAQNPKFNTEAEFTTPMPLPLVKVKLMAEKSGMLSLEDTELGRVVITPTAEFNREEDFTIPKSKTALKDIKIRVSCSMDKPLNMKCAGHIYVQGRLRWRQWKKRYMILVQVSQYTFALCQFVEKKVEPAEFMALTGYVVDYCSPVDLGPGGKFFFNLTKDNDTLVLATDDQREQHQWVQSLSRATGQPNPPRPPTPTGGLESPSDSSNALQQRPNSGTAGPVPAGALRQYDELIQAAPNKFDQPLMLAKLQSLTLDYRLADEFASLGWFSPSQTYVLDEYCARYGVRGSLRYLSLINDCLDRAEQGVVVDPALIHVAYSFCQSHVAGGKPDNLASIMIEERDRLTVIKQRLATLLEYQITNFRYCFPFGRPEGALKSALALLEKVLQKDWTTPANPDEIQAVLKKWLENAAFVNYTQISEYARIEAQQAKQNQLQQQGYYTAQQQQEALMASPSYQTRLEELMHLAELCIDTLRQNEENYADAFTFCNDLLTHHSETFWSLFAVDMNGVLELQPPDTWDSFPLFQLLNDYLITDKNLKNGIYHSRIQDIFAPQVIRYVDLMESSIAQSVARGFDQEKWKPQDNGCATSEDMLWKLDALQSFIHDLHWPEEVFAEHLEVRLKQMACDMIQAAVARILAAFEAWMKKGGRGTDYALPSEVCVMLNVIIDFKNQSVKLCHLPASIAAHTQPQQYRAAFEEEIESTLNQFTKLITEKLTSILDEMLKKMARFDEGSIMSSVLSIAKPLQSGSDETGKDYIKFVGTNIEALRTRIVDEIYVLTIFERWFGSQMRMIGEWLAARQGKSLSPYQLTVLFNVMKKVYSEFEIQGVSEKVLEGKSYQTVLQRIKAEEATAAVKEGRPDRVKQYLAQIAAAKNPDGVTGGTGTNSAPKPAEPVAAAPAAGTAAGAAKPGQPAAAGAKGAAPAAAGKGTTSTPAKPAGKK